MINMILYYFDFIKKIFYKKKEFDLSLLLYLNIPMNLIKNLIKYTCMYSS